MAAVADIILWAVYEINFRVCSVIVAAILPFPTQRQIESELKVF